MYYDVTVEELDVENKLDNMLDSEIDETIYNYILKYDKLKLIEDYIMRTLSYNGSPFSNIRYYDSIQGDSLCDRIYNCDALYVHAIEEVLHISLHSHLDFCKE